MNSPTELRFADLDGFGEIPRNPGENLDSLEKWYLRVRWTPIHRLDDFDISRAFGQGFFPERLVPEALSRIERQRGKDFEDLSVTALLSAMAGTLDAAFWTENRVVAAATLHCLRGLQLQGDQRERADELIERISRSALPPAC